MSDTDFLEIFKNQLSGELQRATDLALTLERKAGDRETLQSLMREFHTIKGAARAIQFDEIKVTAHHLEDVYHALLDGQVEQRPALIDLTFFTIDLIQELLDKSLNKQPLPDYQLLKNMVETYLAGEDPKFPKSHKSVAENIFSATEHSAGEEPLAHKEPSAINAPSADAKLPEAQAFLANEKASSRKPSAQALSTHQTDEQLMDNLFNLSGEIAIAVGSFDPQRSAIRKVALGLSQLERQFEREGFHDLVERLQQIAKHQSEAIELLDNADNRMRFLSEELDDQVNAARLVPLDRVFSSYPRIVRDLAKDLNKDCTLSLTGEHTRIDRGVLEAVRAPLLHLIRNAIDHGIESAVQRQQHGKSATGQLRIQAMQLGSQIQIRIEDDGAGIDMNAVKQKVLERGDTSEALWDAMNLGEQQQFLFLPGFSLASAVTDISGRGVGLDVVKSNIEKVGGRVSVASKNQRGTLFTLELPLTLSMTRCLLVQGGKHPFFGVQHYAFPENELESVQRIRSEDIRLHEGKESLRINDKSLPLFSFSSLMGLSPLKENLDEKYVLILGECLQIALVVETVIEEQAIVRRRFDERLGKLPNIDGVSLLRNGAMALIIDMQDLFQTLADPTTQTSSIHDDHYSETEAEHSHKVLVVEDSQTVREVEKHFLESAGFNVSTAVDGVDGYNKIRSNAYDLVISDIDMPRMNGIELIEKIRQDEKHKNLPVIVVSYKDREEDKQKALHAGANYYVVKSEFDTDTMIERINTLLSEDAVIEVDQRTIQ